MLATTGITTSMTLICISMLLLIFRRRIADEEQNNEGEQDMSDVRQTEVRRPPAVESPEGSGLGGLWFLLLLFCVYALVGAALAWFAPAERPMWMYDFFKLDRRPVEMKILTGHMKAPENSVPADKEGTGKQVFLPGKDVKMVATEVLPPQHVKPINLARGDIVAMTGDAVQIKLAVVLKVACTDPERLRIQTGIETQSDLFDRAVEPYVNAAARRALNQHFIEEFLEKESLRRSFVDAVSNAELGSDTLKIEDVKLERIMLPERVKILFQQKLRAAMAVKTAEMEKERAIMDAKVRIEQAKAVAIQTKAEQQRLTDIAKAETERQIIVWKMKKDAGMPVGEKPKTTE